MIYAWTEKETRKTTLLTEVSNNIKYLGVTLTKQVKEDLYDKKFKTLKEESKDPRICKISHAHGLT